MVALKGLLFSLLDSEFDACCCVVVVVVIIGCIATDMMMFLLLEKCRTFSATQSRYALPRRCGLMCNPKHFLKKNLFLSSEVR